MANLKKPGLGNVEYLVVSHPGTLDSYLNNINLLFLGTNGACCRFPFKYDGKMNYKCNEKGEPQPWCATTVIEDKDDDDYLDMITWEFCGHPSCKKGKSVL